VCLSVGAGCAGDRDVVVWRRSLFCLAQRGGVGADDVDIVLMELVYEVRANDGANLRGRSVMNKCIEFGADSILIEFTGLGFPTSGAEPPDYR